MAEHETPEPQLLHEFTQNLIMDLKSGAITAQEALAAGWQYSFLREELGGEEEALRAALLVGGDAFKDSLITAFTAIQTKLADLPNFASQLPDVPRIEQEIRDVAALRAFAIDRFQKTSQAQSPKATRAHREFIHTLVSKYGSTMPTITEVRVESALLTASKDTSAATNPQAFAQTLVSSLGGSETIKSDVLDIITQDPEFLPALAAQERRDSAVYTAILNHMECDRPDVLVDVVLSAPPTEPMEQSILRATKLAQVAEALDVSYGRKTGKLQFFSSEGAKGVAGGLQKGADGILSLVGEPVREMILAEKVNGTIRDMLKGSQKFADRLGENFVRSAFFTHVTQDLTKQLGEKTQITGQVRTVFDDLISSIIRGPLDPALKDATEGKMLDYYELMRANANAPKDKKFMPPGYALWDVFRLREERKGENAATRRRGWFPYLGLSSLGGWISNLFSSLVDRTTSSLFTNPRVPGQLASSRRAAAIPIPIGEDMPLLVALIVVLVIVIFFVFPSNFNLTQLSHSSKASALLAALFQQEPAVDHGVICTDCKWPTNGCISQGPNTPYDSHSSGIDANAIDIAADLGQPVISITNGIVVNSRDGCLNFLSIGCNDGYGNYVDIRSSDDNKTYRYAHMMKGSIIDNGAQVSKGTQIGLVDSSGTSTGSHVHFELVTGQSGSVNDVLPYDVPGCVGQYDWMPGPNCPDLMGGTEKSCVSIK